MNGEMNMKMAGSGTIPAGEYNEVSVSGSSRLHGTVRCVSFSSSGSVKGENIECLDDFKVSGSASFSGNVKSKRIGVSGSVKCGESVKCEELSVSGSMRVGGDVEAETVEIHGCINCEGLLNAEDVEIKFDTGMHIGSIGGSKIVIFSKNPVKPIKRLSLFASLCKSRIATVAVSSSVEGDEIALEYVTCPRVTGRVVAIGCGCDIELVQYSEIIEIHPDAKVGKTEKI